MSNKAYRTVLCLSLISFSTFTTCLPERFVAKVHAAYQELRQALKAGYIHVIARHELSEYALHAYEIFNSLEVLQSRREDLQAAGKAINAIIKKLNNMYTSVYYIDKTGYAIKQTIKFVELVQKGYVCLALKNKILAGKYTLLA